MPDKNLKNIAIRISFLAAIAIVGLFLRNNLADKKEVGKNDKIEITEVRKEETKPEEKKKEEFTGYQNQAYNYSLKFSDKWKMNNDFSEVKLEKKEINDEFEAAVGGQTFWSNYADINKYNPGNRPADFRLLALTVYSVDEKNITTKKFAEKLGFVKEITESVPFETENIKGREFVSPGAKKGEPRIAIIFQKEQLFYVFNLAFAGNKETVGEMENIVRTFGVN